MLPKKQKSIQEALWGAEQSPVGALAGGGGLTKGGGSGQFEAAPGWWQIPEVLEQVLLLPEWQRGLVAKTHVC